MGLSRVYKSLLRVYPAEFRHEYGGQMEIVFLDRLAAADGLLQRAAVWIASLRDLAASAPREHLDILWRDVRYSLRSLQRSPSFAVVAIGALAAGIGINTAIFSVIYGVLLKPLPFPDPDQLVVVTESLPQRDLGSAAGPDFGAWRQQSRLLSVVAVCNESTHILGGAEGAESVPSAAATAELFPLLGASPYMGRGFTEADTRPDAPAVAVLSYTSWRTRFRADPGVIGETITLDAKPFQVVGVLGPGFSFPSRTEVWTPSQEDYLAQRTQVRISMAEVIARVRKGVSPADAERELTAIATTEWHRSDVIAGYRDMVKGIRAKVTPLAEVIVGSSRQQLSILFAAVSLVLVIACVNVANLLVAKAVTRRREMAVRLALGAGRPRLTRQVLTESLTLAVISVGLGIAIAWVVLRVLLASGGSWFPRSEEIGIDWVVLSFAVFAGGLTGIVFGLAPVLFVSRTSLNDVIKAAARGTGGPGLPGLRSALVACQLALALVLLCGAGLLIRSFVTLRQVNPGFAAKNLLTAQITLPASRYKGSSEMFAFHQEALRRLKELPNVESVGLNPDLPITGSFGNQVALTVEGHPHDPNLPLFGSRTVTAEYFRAMAIPLRAGRLFTEADASAGSGGIIVNEAFARLYFGVPEAIGKRVRWAGDNGPWTTIIGVVGDVRHAGLSSAVSPEIYVLYTRKQSLPQVSYVIRTKDDPARSMDRVRSTIRSVDSGVVVGNLMTMEDRIRGSLSEREFQTLVLSAFAVLAVALAGVGVYGVVSYTVSQRAHEMGIRIALGAGSDDIFLLVMRDVLAMAVIGLVIGAVGAWSAGRAISGLLFQVHPTDPWALGGAAVVLLSVAVLGGLAPSWRATSLDPVTTLRTE